MNKKERGLRSTLCIYEDAWIEDENIKKQVIEETLGGGIETMKKQELADTIRMIYDLTQESQKATTDPMHKKFHEGRLFAYGQVLGIMASGYGDDIRSDNIKHMAHQIHDECTYIKDTCPDWCKECWLRDEENDCCMLKDHEPWRWEVKS